MCELSRDKQLKIKAYESLNLWNNHEANMTHLHTKWIVIVPAATIIYAVHPGGPPHLVRFFVIVLSIALTRLLIYLFKKADLVIAERYRLLRKLECELDFCAHRDVKRFVDCKGLTGRYNKSRIIVGYIGFYLLIATALVMLICAITPLWPTLCETC